MWRPGIRELLDEIGTHAADLGEAFGIPGLQMETVGGGYHLIPPGGYLAVHTDFNRSPDTGLHRRLNLLVYLNDGWWERGGQLELWDQDRSAVSIDPELNRTVVFATSDQSWHGHPRPASRWRRSVAAYFFTEEEPPGYSVEHSTIWHPNGGVQHA
jgi:Rps23 Pro-64 3,4-dihydroxylase Tpa1-like proline 4-hydroxylase